jgi:hypothetical protein
MGILLFILPAAVFVDWRARSIKQLHEIDRALEVPVWIDEVLGYGADFLPSKPAIKPLARATGNRIQKQQRTT